MGYTLVVLFLQYLEEEMLRVKFQTESHGVMCLLS